MSDEALGDPLRTMHRKPFMLLCCFLRGVVDVQPLHSQMDAWHYERGCSACGWVVQGSAVVPVQLSPPAALFPNWWSLGTLCCNLNTPTLCVSSSLQSRVGISLLSARGSLLWRGCQCLRCLV